MASNRDDFKAKTIDIMAKRVGYRCSNPNCRKLTCGANDDPENYSNIGVAAHICAAAPGGKRYDTNMTSAERKDIQNGIWLCQSCSKLIDSDDIRYTVDLLHKWKQLSEEAAILELESASPAQNTERDISLIKFYVQCFDRPAFQDDIRQEGRMEDFDRAIEDTIIALRSSGHWMISAGLVCCKRTHAGGRMGVLLPICIMWYDGGVQCWLRSIYWIIWLIKWDAEFFLIFGCSSKVNGCTGSLPRSL